MTPPIHAVFATWPDLQRSGLEHLRHPILAQAVLLPEIGRVSEELRWDQPAYLTPDAHTTCSLRIGMAKQDFALFVHCRTNQIETFAAGPGAGMRFQGTRAVLFGSETEVNADPQSLLIRAALTYPLAF